MSADTFNREEKPFNDIDPTEEHFPEVGGSVSESARVKKRLMSHETLRKVVDNQCPLT